MDIRITKKRLNDHLSYDWIKYLMIILAAILLWSLILTMAKPRVPNGKIFNLFIVAPGYNAQTLDSTQKELRKVIDPAVLEVNVTFWGSKESTTEQLIQTRLATQEPDAMIFSNPVPKPGMSEEEAEKVVSRFKANVDAGGFNSITEMLAEIDEMQFDEAEFRARVKREKKFNKIDTESDMLEAIAAEKQRIQALKDAAYEFRCYVGELRDEQYPEVPNVAFRYVRGTQVGEVPAGETEQIWGINLAEVAGSAPVLSQIKTLLSYETEAKPEDNVKEYALGLMFKQQNLPYHYEYIKVLNYFIRTFR